MKNRALLLLLFLALTNVSFAQINQQLNSKPKIQWSDKLDLDFSQYKVDNLELKTTPQLITNQDISTFDNNFKDHTFWAGSSMSQSFNYQNLKFKTQYEFDINGNLKRSSMSVKFK